MWNSSVMALPSSWVFIAFGQLLLSNEELYQPQGDSMTPELTPGKVVEALVKPPPCT